MSSIFRFNTFIAMRFLLKLLFFCTGVLFLAGCSSPIESRISELKKNHGIPQEPLAVINSKTAEITYSSPEGGNLWRDLYLKGSTIVFVFQEPKDTYINGIWGDDYKEYLSLLESERILSYGSERMNDWFNGIDLSGYRLREDFLDHSGSVLFSLEYNISDLNSDNNYQIPLPRLERLIELTKGIFPISTLEGVDIVDAEWNRTDNRIDLSVMVNRRSVSPLTFYDYDEDQFKSYIDNNWKKLLNIGLFEVIDRNGIPVSFNVNNQGQVSSVLYDYKDYTRFHSL